jgi:iron complex transport system ATP-binding protein
LNPTDPLLHLRHVTVRRGDKDGLRDLDLDIHCGEHLAILGPNGSGKSTLIKVITRELYPLARPDLICRMFGQETWDVFELRSRFGLVSNDLQATYARPITAFEAILSGFFSSIGLWPAHQVTPAMEAKARSVMARLEVGHLAERSIGDMSSGEARRLLIGRALVHDPQALLLDEPTNSLDFRAAHEFREIVRKLAQEGHTIVMVTHTVADVIPEIGRVVLLKAGRIHGDGPVEQMLCAPVLSDLFEMPLRVERAEGRYGLW